MINADYLSKYGDGLNIVINNVGQGDHSYVILPEDKIGIIDFYCKGQSEPAVLTFLKEKLEKCKEEEKKLTIAFICITHCDRDHIEGLGLFSQWAIDNFDHLEIENIWLPSGDDRQTILFFIKRMVKQFKRKLEAKERIKIDKLIDHYDENIVWLDRLVEKWNKHEDDNEEDYLTVGLLNDNFKNTKFLCVAPTSAMVNNFTQKVQQGVWKTMFDEVFLKEKVFEREAEVLQTIGENVQRIRVDRNITSSAIFIKHCEKYNLVFGGDVPKEVWEASWKDIKKKKATMLDNKFSCQFIKASHHGSYLSSSPTLWETLIPQEDTACVVFSAGTKYGHPHDQTLQEIKATAEKKKTKIDFYKTNMCMQCLENIDSVVHMDQSSEEPQLSPESAELLNREASGNLTPAQTHSKRLAGFFFHYPNDESKRPEQSIMVSNDCNLIAYDKQTCQSCS